MGFAKLSARRDNFPVTRETTGGPRRYGNTAQRYKGGIRGKIRAAGGIILEEAASDQAENLATHHIFTLRNNDIQISLSFPVKPEISMST